MDAKSYNIRVPKRWARLTLIVGVTALIVAPLTAVAMHTFNDVPDTHTFHADIEWLEASGVTKGCNPPANTLFCPDDDVTRGQMAAFMNRFAGYLGAEDGTPAQADNAGTLAGQSANAFRTLMVSSSTDVFADTNFGSMAPGSFQEIDVVTITVPAAGVIRIDASAAYNVATGAESVVNWIEMDAGTPCDADVNTTGDLDPAYLHGSLSAGSTVDEFFDTISSVAVSVGAAGTHTFSLCSEAWEGTPNVMGTAVQATWLSSSSASIIATNSGNGGGTVGE